MNYALAFLISCFMATTSVAQTTFKSIHTLLSKNFDAVNQGDSAYYMSLLNRAAIYKGKKLKSREDTLKVLKPFSDAFSDLLHQLADLSGSNEVEVKFEDYKSLNTAEYDATATGKLLLQVNLLINNTFMITMPFTVSGYQGTYAIESPMLVMFADN